MQVLQQKFAYLHFESYIQLRGLHLSVLHLLLLRNSFASILLCDSYAWISWQCIVIVSRAWVSWPCCTQVTSQEMIRLRVSFTGCRIRTVSKLRWINRWWTLVYWDFTGTHQSFYWVSHPMFRLPGVACEHSRVLLIVLLWRISFARQSSHASRGEARRQRLMFKARLR